MTLAITIDGQAQTTVRLRSGLAIAVAILVGLLVAGTLGTISAVVIGTGLHLLGVPGDWAFAAAIVTAGVSLVPSAAFARRAWTVERDGIERLTS